MEDTQYDDGTFLVGESERLYDETHGFFKVVGRTPKCLRVQRYGTKVVSSDDNEEYTTLGVTVNVNNPTWSPFGPFVLARWATAHNAWKIEHSGYTFYIRRYNNPHNVETVMMENRYK
jgi:hypothetical protein